MESRQLIKHQLIRLVIRNFLAGIILKSIDRVSQWGFLAYSQEDT